MRIRLQQNSSPSLPAMLAGVWAGAFLVARFARMRRRIDFRGKVVVISGGSRGLGLEIARLLASEGARVAILARNEPELQAAQDELKARSLLAIRQEELSPGPRVLAIPCDIGDRDQAEDAVRQVVDQYGRIDALINAAGIMQVAPIDHLTVEDFENAMAVHFWGPLYTMLAVIPHMRRAGGGRIVNISSIGGKVGLPHLAPYSASKFALEGLSDTFRAELARDQILVSTINPGLMRTGSFYHGNYKGQQPKEFAWFSMMASTPLTAMQSQRAARQVLSSARHGDAERTLTWQARVLQITEELFPNFTAMMMKAVNSRLLPGPGGLQAGEIKTGFESRPEKIPASVTKLGDQAAERNNEMIAERGL